MLGVFYLAMSLMLTDIKPSGSVLTVIGVSVGSGVVWFSTLLRSLLTPVFFVYSDSKCPNILQ